MKRLLGILATALVLTTTGCGGDADAGDASSGKTLRIGVIGSKDTLNGPVGFLHSRHQLLPALKKEGFTKIEVFPFPNGPDLNQALVGGSLDLATYGDTPALVARGSGLDTRLVSLATVSLDASVLVRKDGPTSLAGLDGKKIGVQTGSYIHRYLLGALRDADVEPSELPHIYSTDIEAPLERGDIAAAAVPQANAEVLRAKGYRVIDHLAEDHPDYAGTSVTVSTGDFLGDHPAFAGTWRTLQNDAARQALADWNGYVEFALTLSDFPDDLIRSTIRRDQLPTEAFPGPGVGLLESTKEFLVEEGFVKKDFSVGKWRA
ncbi:hypothetical protein SRB5_11470 [Streptomyces sp. RB5]|uniref:SsuA/THI5-like domain-containing protein n=1 Tax=Streptomyces smaragdinus TaxID=2585196 RepID=A0A7K0CCA2_9ACTN|nr:ABC transporter substrate-binding protein [Streptomyces smaragdinus]MQY11033.1 hypothetical protein [Streptomyces smaragdinus]